MSIIVHKFVKNGQNLQVGWLTPPTPICIPILIYFTDENSAKMLLNIYRRHHGANDVVIDKDLNARATLGCRSQCTHGFGHHIGKFIIL